MEPTRPPDGRLNQMIHAYPNRRESVQEGQRVVGCRGGSQYVEGVLGSLVPLFLGFGFLGFLVVGFLVCWFLGFEVVWFIGCCLLGFEVSRLYQTSIYVCFVLF